MPTIHPDTQFDTALSRSITQRHPTWTKGIKNTITQNFLSHPLQNPITVFQIYHNSHYTTLITDNINYHYYDGLNLPILPPSTSIHNKLRD